MDANMQFEEYKRNIKDEIKHLIHNGETAQAKAAILEYEKVVPNDIEIINMKVIINMVEGDHHAAEVVLWQAVERNLSNADTFYNLAYLQEMKGEDASAYRFYNKAMQIADDFQLRLDVEAAMGQLQPRFSRQIDHAAKRFIILSSCNWSIMLQRPHHIAKALAQFGHIVDYVEPGRQLGTVGNPDVTHAEAVSFSKKEARKQGLIQIYSPLSLSYEGKVVLDNYKSLVQDLIMSSDEEVVLICYLPDAIVTLEELQGNFKVIYECVDDHSDLEYSFWNSKRDREYEIRLIERADFITTTSTALYLTKSINRENVYLSKNAVNRLDFQPGPVMDIPEDLRTVPGPKVCYMGAVYKWFDEELFYRLVRSNKDLSFVVIGPVMEGMLVEHEDNLYLLGTKDHSDLKRYLLHMDAGIIPFKDNANIIVNCNPIKCYEYVSCGLPVIATNMPELVTDKEFLHVSNDFKEFNRLMRESLNMRLQEEQINAFLTENDWQARGRLILDVLCGNDDEHRKNRVVAKLESLWGEQASEGLNPTVQSIYSLTFAENDRSLFLKHASAAYDKLKTSFTLSCYIYAALMNDLTEECVEKVVKDPNVGELFIAELLFLRKHRRNEMIRIKLFYISNNYQFIRPAITKLQNDDHTVELAHYYYETGDYANAETEYSKLLNSGSDYLSSPMLNWNLADLLIQMGALQESKSFKTIAKASIERYIGKESMLHGMAEVEPDRTRFSIVIPTRNNHHTLEFTLKTCLNQSFEKYEIIVSDNSSNDLTKQLINRLNDPKIKYCKPERELAMTENFNFAISHATGEYVMVLGSDDGLLFHALNTLDTLLDSFQAKLMNWNLLAYGWPDVMLDGYQNHFGIPSVVAGKIGHQYRDGREIIHAVSQFQVSYSVLPMLYCNSVVHRDVLAELMKKTGGIYKSLSPDIYSGIVLAYLQRKYVFIDIPISIGGSSGNSNGIAYMFGKDKKADQIKSDYVRLNSSKGFYMYGKVPNVKATEIAVGDSFYRAKEALFPHDNGLELNRKKMIEKCVQALNEHDATESLYRMYNSLEDDAELQKWFYETYLESPDAPVGRGERMFGYKKGFMENGSGLIVNAMDFGVKDVYGAAELFRKITGM